MKLTSILTTLAIAGLVATGDLATAAKMSLTNDTLHCGPLAKCANSTSCEMIGAGPLADDMYLEHTSLYPNATYELEYLTTTAPNIKEGQIECTYVTNGNWATFRSIAKNLIYPLFNGTNSFWQRASNNVATCPKAGAPAGNPTLCPVTDTVPQLRA